MFYQFVTWLYMAINCIRPVLFSDVLLQCCRLAIWFSRDEQHTGEKKLKKQMQRCQEHTKHHHGTEGGRWNARFRQLPTALVLHLSTETWNRSLQILGNTWKSMNKTDLPGRSHCQVEAYCQPRVLPNRPNTAVWTEMRWDEMSMCMYVLIFDMIPGGQSECTWVNPLVLCNVPRVPTPATPVTYLFILLKR